MGKFNGKIRAEFTPPKTWKLDKTLSFSMDDLTQAEIGTLHQIGANIAGTGRITCKTGMQTDLASVPRIAWAVIAPWDVARAAVIHDHLYAALRKYYHSEGMNKKVWRAGRELSDRVFLEGMKSADPKVPKFKMYSAYWSVRAFGRWPASAGKEVKFLSGKKE